jgi:hypothetical protein
MRQKLNENPMLQIAVIGVLLVIVGIFFLSSMGGGGEAESTATTSAATVSPTEEAPGVDVVSSPAPEASAQASSSSPPTVPAAPLPKGITKAFQDNRTVALLVVEPGGIEDRMVAASVHRLARLPKVSAFVVPADQIARYTAITQGVMVERVPALIVVRPKQLDGSIATASVSYGFQSPESVIQAVVDANYKGPTLPYHP